MRGYDTPSGVSGVLGAPSMAVSASSAEPSENASGPVPLYLRKAESFEKYLDTIFL